MSRIGVLKNGANPLQDDVANGIELLTIGVPLREGSKAIRLDDGSALSYLNPATVDPFDLCNKAAQSIGLTIADDPASWQRVLDARKRHAGEARKRNDDRSRSRWGG